MSKNTIWAAVIVGFGVVLAVVVFVVASRATGDSVATPTVTTPTNPAPIYGNPDGRTPKCFENFTHTGQVCNTSPDIVDASQIALDMGGTSAINEIDKELLNACVSNGNSIYDCSGYLSSTVIPLIIDNLVHGMPQREN